MITENQFQAVKGDALHPIGTSVHYFRPDTWRWSIGIVVGYHALKVIAGPMNSYYIHAHIQDSDGSPFESPLDKIRLVNPPAPPVGRWMGGGR